MALIRRKDRYFSVCFQYLCASSSQSTELHRPSHTRWPQNTMGTAYFLVHTIPSELHLPKCDGNAALATISIGRCLFTVIYYHAMCLSSCQPLLYCRLIMPQGHQIGSHPQDINHTYACRFVIFNLTEIRPPLRQLPRILRHL